MSTKLSITSMSLKLQILLAFEYLDIGENFTINIFVSLRRTLEI